MSKPTSVRSLDSSTADGQAALMRAISVSPVEVLAREHLPDKILRALLEQAEDPIIADGLARFREEPWVLSALPLSTPALPHNPHTPPDVLEAILEAVPTRETREALARNPNSPDALLMKLGVETLPIIAASRYSFSPMLMQYIAQHIGEDVLVGARRNWRTNALVQYLEENLGAESPAAEYPTDPTSPAILTHPLSPPGSFY